MKNELIYLFLINVGSGIGYSLIAPLFPLVAIEKGISESLIGFIISIFAISNSIITPFSQKFFRKFGKLNTFFYALILEALCLLLFSILQVINNQFFFVLTALMVRIVHGGASALTAVLIYSIGSTLVHESENIETLGFLELGWNVGLSTGPLFASYLYYLAGYKAPFIFFSVLLVILIFFLKNIEIEENSGLNDTYSIFDYLKNPYIFLIFLAIALDLGTKTFFFPTLSNHLFTKFDLSVEKSSNFFVIGMISYFLSLKIIKILSEKFRYKILILSGFLINLICVLFIPPVDFLYQSYYTIGFGLFLSGISSAAIIIPGICELINILKEIYPENKEQNNDIASLIWNFGNYVGDSIGPFLGGVITNHYGFKSSCIVISWLNIIFSCYFFYINKQFIIKDLYLSREKLNSFKESGLLKNDLDFNIIQDNDKCDYEKTKLKSRKSSMI